MTPERLDALAAKYKNLKIAVVGDYCLDRYLEINPDRTETSIETGLPVYNVERVRAQAGAAGTILNNLVALGVGSIYPVGFRGNDGEGYELEKALRAMTGVDLSHFVLSEERRTFTYAKPLMMLEGKPPRELNRLDTKNWTETPKTLSLEFSNALKKVLVTCDAVILMDQVDCEDTGVVTAEVLDTLRSHSAGKLVIADSRRGLGHYPPCLFKMNVSELGRMFNETETLSDAAVRYLAIELARKNAHPTVITMAHKGLLAAEPSSTVSSAQALPPRGPIDIVGAGDSVTANLAASLAAGADLGEALTLSALASSVVIHQLGTAGAASIAQMRLLLSDDNTPPGATQCIPQ
jgi:rfaE bifunctional protein kinase chain/domain